MRRIIVAALGLASLALAGCATATAPPGGLSDAAITTATTVADATLPAPVVLADRTTMDESSVVAFEKLVRVGADLATLAVKAKLVRGADLDRLSDLSVKARVGVRTMRLAYKATNAASYVVARRQVNDAIDAIRAITSKGNVP